MGVSIALKQLLFALNKNSSYIIITIATSFLSLFVLYFLVNKIGLQGAFISTIIIEFLVIVLYCGVLKQLLFLKK
jgi:O-antigen/teichoic acid export membrane protein